MGLLRAMPSLVLTAMLGATSVGAAQEVKTVATLDLNRYLGRWYEIARYPNRFQKQCLGDVTADYARRDDGRLSVTNRCRLRDGTFETAVGVARVDDPVHAPAKLKVRFAPAILSFIPQVWGNYWVLGLAPDYRYAVVGDPKHEYLWILSRTPQMSADDYQAALAAATANGFDAAHLVRTPQANP